MSVSEGEVLPAEWLKKAMPFKPSARYYQAMDHLLYLNEDCSYRSQWIDPTLDVLLHPYEDRIVGAKISGFAHIVKKDLHRILGPSDIARALVRSIWLMLERWAQRTKYEVSLLLH